MFSAKFCQTVCSGRDPMSGSRIEFAELGKFQIPDGMRRRRISPMLCYGLNESVTLQSSAYLEQRYP